MKFIRGCVDLFGEWGEIALLEVHCKESTITQTLIKGYFAQKWATDDQAFAELKLEKKTYRSRKSEIKHDLLGLLIIKADHEDRGAPFNNRAFQIDRVEMLFERYRQCSNHYRKPLRTFVADEIEKTVRRLELVEVLTMPELKMADAEWHMQFNKESGKRWLEIYEYLQRLAMIQSILYKEQTGLPILPERDMLLDVQMSALENPELLSERIWLSMGFSHYVGEEGEHFVPEKLDDAISLLSSNAELLTRSIVMRLSTDILLWPSHYVSDRTLENLLRLVGKSLEYEEHGRSIRYTLAAFVLFRFLEKCYLGEPLDHYREAGASQTARMLSFALSSVSEEERLLIKDLLSLSPEPKRVPSWVSARLYGFGLPSDSALAPGLGQGSGLGPEACDSAILWGEIVLDILTELQTFKSAKHLARHVTDILLEFGANLTNRQHCFLVLLKSGLENDLTKRRPEFDTFTVNVGEASTWIASPTIVIRSVIQ